MPKIHNNGPFTVLARPPSDFRVFNYIKKRLDVHLNAESLTSQIVKIVETIPHQDYINTFNKWQEGMRLCVENKGNFSKHLKK